MAFKVFTEYVPAVLENEILKWERSMREQGEYKRESIQFSTTSAKYHDNIALSVLIEYSLFKEQTE